jgi:hypothetical protein
MAISSQLTMKQNWPFTLKSRDARKGCKKILVWSIVFHKLQALVISAKFCGQRGKDVATPRNFAHG